MWENVSCTKIIALLFLLVTKTTISDGLFICASIESRFAPFRRLPLQSLFSLGSPFYHMRAALLVIFWNPDIFHFTPIYSNSADTTNTVRKIGGRFLKCCSKSYLKPTTSKIPYWIILLKQTNHFMMGEVGKAETAGWVNYNTFSDCTSIWHKYCYSCSKWSTQ